MLIDIEFQYMLWTMSCMVNLLYVNGKGQIESFTNETLFVLTKVKNSLASLQCQQMWFALY